jgi:Icc protein
MPIKLVQLTDCHIGAKTPQGFTHNTQDRLSQVVDALARQPDIDRLLLTGDLVQFGDPANYGVLSQLLEPIDSPQSWIAGNHDEAHCLEYLPAYQERIVALGDKWGLILLNSIEDRDGKGSGSLGALERTWLSGVLKDTQLIFDHLLLAVHHPPLTVGSDWQDAISLGDAHAFYETIHQEHRIRGILCGHLHQEHALTLGAFPVWITPATAHQYIAYTATAKRDHDPITGAPAYRTLLLYPDGRIDTWVERVELP